MKFVTFRVTVSVPGDLSKECETKIVSYFKKKALYAYVVIEYGASVKRHLHAAVCMKEPMEGNNLIGYMWKIVKEHHPSANRKYAMNKHVMVDNAWYNDYLKKEVGVEVIYDNYDKDAIEEHFPTEEEQEALMAHVTEGTTDKPVDGYYSRMEEKWIAFSPDDHSWESAIRFLQDAMFVTRTERVISDTRRFNQVAWSLFCYRTKRVSLDEVHRQYMYNQIGGLGDTVRANGVYLSSYH